jgi:hypothetical protein
MADTVSVVTHLASVVLIVVSGTHAGARTVVAQTASADSSACDRQCFATAMEDFVGGYHRSSRLDHLEEHVARHGC